MPSPVGPNAPNRAFGTTPPAEQQPAPTPEPQQRATPAEELKPWLDQHAETTFTTVSPDTPTAQDPPAPAGGSNTTDTD